MLINTFHLFIFSLLVIHGALGKEWSMKYSHEILCASEGSTVSMSITYTHPTHVKVYKMFWLIDPSKGVEPTDLRNESGYRDRVEYPPKPKPKNFFLKLSHVKKSDEHMYCIRVIGSSNYLFHPGIVLKVTGLRVEAPDTVMEGNKTVLLCATTCSLSDTPAFIWYKENIQIDEKIISSNTLTLQDTKADDAGSYSCAVKGYEDHRSPARRLNVKYRPRKISVSISPSADIVEGGSVNLTCSGDANPPVATYEWFKMKTVIKKDKTLTISKISSEDSGEYKCKCSNEVGHQYSTVNLSVLYSPKNVSVSISHSGEIVEGSSVNLTCRSDANPPVENYTWFRGNTFLGKGKTFTISKISSEDSGEYKCKCSNEIGLQYSTNVTLYIAKIESSNGQTAVIVVIIMCLAGLSLIIIVLLRKKKMFCWSEEPVTADNVAAQSTASDEVQYASIPHRRKAAQDPSNQDLYANVHHQRGHKEEDVQYAMVNFSSNRPEPSTAGDSSVIYSSVK